MLIQKVLSVAAFGAQAVIYVLLALSVLSVSVTIERVIHFRRRRVDVPAIGRALIAKLKAGDKAGAAAQLEGHPSVEAEVIRGALAWYDEGPEAVEHVLSSGVKERRATYEAGLLFLGTLGNNAPFLGLFGTVLGVITAFQQLGENPTGAMSNVMSGIAEALVATAVGILVALPAVIAYNVFQKKAEDIEENVASIGDLILAQMKAKR